MKIFTNIKPRFRHYISIGYGLSQQYYREENDELDSIGQGNKFFEDFCRNVSCIINHQIQKKLLGIFFRDMETGERSQCVAIAFIDDTDFIQRERILRQKCKVFLKVIINFMKLQDLKLKKIRVLFMHSSINGNKRKNQHISQKRSNNL